jgi:hypothetical protein
MSDEYKGMRRSDAKNDDAARQKGQQQPLRDLDSSADEAEKVKGGAGRRADPCEGGEIA